MSRRLGRRGLLLFDDEVGMGMGMGIGRLWVVVDLICARNKKKVTGPWRYYALYDIKLWSTVRLSSRYPAEERNVRDSDNTAT